MARGSYISTKSSDSVTFNAVFLPKNKKGLRIPLGYGQNQIGNVIIRKIQKELLPSGDFLGQQQAFEALMKLISLSAASYLKRGQVFKSMVESAGDILRVIEGHNARFNNYLGALDHSYYALVASPSYRGGQRALIRIDDSVAPWGRITRNTFSPVKKNGKTVIRGGRGGRIIKLTVGRHSITRTKSKKTRKGRRLQFEAYKSRDQLDRMFRYAHKIDEQGKSGYMSRAKRMMPIFKVSGKNKGILLNTMTVFNAAPYANAVHKKHSVLGYGARSGNLSRNLTDRLQKQIFESFSINDLKKYIQKEVKTKFKETRRTMTFEEWSELNE